MTVIRKWVNQNKALLAVIPAFYFMVYLFLPETERINWTVICLSLSGIHLFFSWIPVFFEKYPVWPHLYEMVLRMLAGILLFIGLYFYWIPKNPSVVFMFLGAYLFLMSTDLFQFLRKTK